MPRTRTLSPELLQQAQSALKNLPDSKVQFRLLAIVKTAEKGLKAVADFFEVHTNTLYPWMTQFEQSGVDGLKEKPKGHRPGKLLDAQLHTICQWIETEQNASGEWVHWTLEKLRYVIRIQWDISLAVGPLWWQLKLKGYSH